MSDDQKIPAPVPSALQPLMTALMAFAGVFLLLTLTFGSPFVERKKAEPCVGHCPPPGPMDCTIYGRKKDGSWPSGFECSSTP